MSQRALGQQFTTVMPRRTALHHVTGKRNVEAIKAEGLRPSVHGESGPGVYTHDTPEAAQRMASWQPDNYRVVNMRTTHSLRMLDRTKPGGEEHYEGIRQQTTLGEGTHQERMGKAMTAQGYHGVIYESGGKKDREVVVHDPTRLKVRRRS